MFNERTPYVTPNFKGLNKIRRTMELRDFYVNPVQTGSSSKFQNQVLRLPYCAGFEIKDYSLHYYSSLIKCPLKNVSISGFSNLSFLLAKPFFISSLVFCTARVTLPTKMFLIFLYLFLNCRGCTSGG